jgi:hypothetical protein
VTHYTVTFFKHVLSSNGHRFKAPQEKIEILSENSEEAIETARRRFSEMRQILTGDFMPTLLKSPRAPSELSISPVIDRLSAGQKRHPFATEDAIEVTDAAN